MITFVLDDHVLQQWQTVTLLIICVSLLISDKNKLTSKILVAAALVIALLLYHGQHQQQIPRCRYTGVETYEPTRPLAEVPGPVADPVAMEDDAELQEHYAPESTSTSTTRGQVGIFSQDRKRTAQAFGRHSHIELVNRSKQWHQDLQHKRLST
jgi:hypothetical protein